MINSNNKLFELNYNSKNAELALKQVFSTLPEQAEIYLVGGAVRNALIRDIHKINLPQRDYDQVVISGSKSYINHLKNLGYEEHPYPSNQHEQVVYRKLFDPSKRNDTGYLHWLVFDMHTVDGTSIEQNIKNNAAFTINGCVINARDLFTKNDNDSLVQVLPSAIDDIKNMRLRLNLDGYKKQPSNFYAMLRFMSVGFAAPSKNEIQLLLDNLPNLEHARFARNVEKVFNYVGGESRARELVKSLGVDFDVFNEGAVKSKLFIQ